MSGVLLGYIGAGMVLTTWFTWTRAMRAVRVPANRTPHLVVMGLGVVCGLGALVEEPGAAGGIAATLAILGGGIFLGLRLQTGQDARVPAVKIGEPILEFSALNDRSERFHPSSMRGKPYLLKFFRGHW